MSRADSPLLGRAIFAFGARRSGTLWLQRILAAHPLISAVPSETQLFSHALPPLLAAFHHGARSSPAVGGLHVQRDLLLDAVRDLCDRVLSPYLEPGARYLSERSPAHARAVALIDELYPDARLVHIIRDGRDVARSLRAREWGPPDVGTAAREWRDAVRAARAAAPAERYLEVRYENLLSRPREEIRGLYEWLGLPAGEPVLAAALAEAAVPLNQDAGDPRLAAGKWRKHFSRRDLRAFEAEAGPLLADLGYREDSPAPAMAARRAVRAIRRGARPGRIDEVGGRLADALRVVDAILDALHTGRHDALASLLSEDAPVRVVIDGAPQREGRGPRELAAAAAVDDAWRARQVSGEIHPGVPNFSVVLEYELGPGVRCARVLQALVHGDLCRGVTVYGWASAPPPRASRPSSP